VISHYITPASNREVALSLIVRESPIQYIKTAMSAGTPSPHRKPRA